MSSRSTFSLTTFSLNFHIKGRLICVLIDTVSQPTGKVSGWRQLGKYVVTSRKLFSVGEVTQLVIRIFSFLGLQCFIEFLARTRKN